MNPYENTYVNPIALPDYPIGRHCLEEGHPRRSDFRETADPSVIYDDGVWYLYPSCGMVYRSEDFIHWTHHKMEPYDCGYAPTVVKHRGKYYLLACLSDLYVSDSPMGPFENLGPITDLRGEEVRVYDPMLFSDDDGRLYLYGGMGGSIDGVELCADDPTRLAGEMRHLIKADTENHLWERMGAWNEDGSFCWIEGSWMYKRGGTYYLTYAAPGTEWQTYAMGAYKSNTPLGPWEYMKTNPFMTKKSGIVRGPGHGCIVDGPNGTVWAFYTCCVCYSYKFERRVGFDPIGFDENGDIIPAEASENPVWAPGVIAEPHLGNGAGLVPVTQGRECTETSAASGRDGLYAVDDSMLSWWQPAEDDPAPALTVEIGYSGLDIYSARIIWRDVGLDVAKGYLPGPFKYKIEALSMGGEWVCVLDKTDNDVDMAIDYNTVTPMRATAVRLTITDHPEHIQPGVINFTVFGKWTPAEE